MADHSPCVYTNRVDAFCCTLCIGTGLFKGSLSQHIAYLARIFENRHQSLTNGYNPKEADALIQPL
jgi:hypothetical protein